MLKSQTVALPDRGSPQLVTITELPALVADRAARAALTAIGADPDGGVVALAVQHAPAVQALGAAGIELLQPFVSADREPSNWRGVLQLQHAALALHVGFLVGRPQLQVPVAMQGEAIMRDSGTRALFCSPQIATVLHSGRATYRELETVLSTEDVFNIVELLNVEAVREWRAAQQSRT